MLKLRKVELQGFKSFCDSTELRFNGEGIAAVVGPNGCGKSNLSDAISWVLGEQSAQEPARRADGRRDLRGHQARKPLGMASVTMVLVDPVAQHAPLLAAAKAHEDAAVAEEVQAAEDPNAEPGAHKVQEIHTVGGHGGVHAGTAQNQARSPSPGACTVPAKANT